MNNSNQFEYTCGELLEKVEKSSQVDNATPKDLDEERKLKFSERFKKIGKTIASISHLKAHRIYDAVPKYSIIPGRLIKFYSLCEKYLTESNIKEWYSYHRNPYKQDYALLIMGMTLPLSTCSKHTSHVGMMCRRRKNTKLYRWCSLFIYTSVKEHFISERENFEFFFINFLHHMKILKKKAILLGDITLAIESLISSNMCDEAGEEAEACPCEIFRADYNLVLKKDIEKTFTLEKKHYDVSRKSSEDGSAVKRTIYHDLEELSKEPKKAKTTTMFEDVFYMKPEPKKHKSDSEDRYVDVETLADNEPSTSGFKDCATQT